MTNENLTPIPGATPRYDDDGRERVDVATCGTCGRSWNDAQSSSLTPAPSGRCPFEYEHEDEPEHEEQPLALVYSVTVHGRMDGLYLFADEADATRFAEAVIQAGGEVEQSDEPINDAATTDELIAAE